ncbi:unnamed protein product [Nezara viridula]|uniref:Uncharacterized protein n=1 Tax=Nezara viridula TaxID=85310 RepID=A0A9P0HKI0_NEZVI|nr:unnamed protein product [Nezara viridula]
MATLQECGVNCRHLGFVCQPLVHLGNRSLIPNWSSQGREDLSPANSLNGFSADSCDGSKKKKGSAARQQEELCLVCGDRASGSVIQLHI